MNCHLIVLLSNSLAVIIGITKISLRGVEIKEWCEACYLSPSPKLQDVTQVFVETNVSTFFVLFWIYERISSGVACNVILAHFQFPVLVCKQPAVYVTLVEFQLNYFLDKTTSALKTIIILYLHLLRVLRFANKIFIQVM